MPIDLEQTIKRLRKQNTDNALVEVKACSEGLSKDVWDTVSAFANTQGGTLVLGLSEADGFVPTEHFDLNRVKDQFLSGCSRSNAHEAKVEPIPFYDIERREFEEKPLLVINIAELDLAQKPCFVKSKGKNGGSFKRVDDADERLTATEVYELENATVLSSADRGVVEEAMFSDLDTEMVDLLLDRQKDSKALRGTTTREEGLFRLNVLNKAGEVRLAGLLALGSYPQQFYPKLCIDVAAHPGTSKAEAGAPRFLDRQLCEGYLGEAIDDAIAATLNNLRTYSYVEGTTRRDEPEIPVEVFREAVVNAAVHREYSAPFYGQAVTIDIYSDRVEITNPGGLWGGKTLKNLDDGQSRCRNATLLKLLSVLSYPDGRGSFAEGQGSGIGLMVREMKSRALGAPEFKAGLDYFTVILPRGGAELAENNAWFESRFGRELSRRERSILAIMRQDHEVDAYDLHKRLGIDSFEIESDLLYFVMEGVVKELGNGRYTLIDGRGGLKISKTEEELLKHMSVDDPIGIQDLAALSGRNISTLRAQMAKLVKKGLVIPTAPATSKSRKYLKNVK